MKKSVLIAVAVLGTLLLSAQDMKKFNLYKPEENAAEALGKAIKEAKASNKYVFVQIGGNWCVWCARFHEFCQNDKQIDSAIRAGFVTYHLNYSPENKNKEILTRLGFPQRFGFPVFIILDGNGNRIHTQNSAYLEEGKSYSKQRVLEFFDNWSPSAMDPKKYVNY